jgi:opacity protein-like surface antigen
MRNCLLAILIFSLPAISTAQGYGSGRAQSWDFSLGAIYQQGDVASGDGGSSLDVDNAWGIGFSVGYNLTNRINISGDFDFLRPDYTAIVVTEPNPPDGSMDTTRIDHRLSQFNGRLKGTYYFTDGPFVPFVEAGIGWSYIDSNVASGPPQGFCWWHPWWGYICESFVDTFSSTEFSYGGALGFRYEMVGNTFIKASYNYWLLDTGGPRADPTLESVRIEYGWRF